MPFTIDPPQPAPHRRKIIAVLVILAVLFIAGRAALSFYVNLLWFESLGYGHVFIKTIFLQCGIFAFFAVVTFAILYGAFSVLRRAHLADLPSTHSIVISGQPVMLSVEPVLRVVGLLVSLGIALVTGVAMAQQWSTLALFWYAPHISTVTDPIFGRPLHFFLFTLPAWQIIDGWLLTLAIATCAIAVLFVLITGGADALDKRRIRFGASPWRGLSATGAFLLLVLAMNVYVSRFSTLLDHQTIFDGVTYTDAHITLGGLLLVCIALVGGAIVAAVNATRKPRGRLLLVAVAPAVLCFVGVSLVGWYVSSFIVKPNELVREEPYISHNITMTRQAFGLDRFSREEFPAETTVASADAANNQATLSNIRLWDWRALQDTLRQVQEIRTYYDFPDIDIDRYDINGTTREVMLAARELNVDKLPVSSRNWINERLIYTHGYGVTMNPVNGFTSEGLPDLYLKNMPVESTVPGLKVTRPEIYYGELTNTDVYVKTGQKEFDYPQGQTNNLTSYAGTGGIRIGGFLRRLVLAFDRGDLGKLPFSDDVTPDSRLLMRRTIRARVAALAPFLTLDQDPYIVVGRDGRLSWIIDAFTTSDSYPYSTSYPLGDNSVNYMRNSVKVVIDAYNGNVTFYVFDPADPVLGAYRRLFPSLFRDASEMPAGLRKHVRYPELLFQLQAEVYSLYHMTDPEVFFNREDLWTVATETGLDDNGEQVVQTMQPNYVMMKLPGGTKEEFVEILPFTPANRNNLIGWIAGRSDGAAYGTAVVYDFPKTRLVDGPQQIEARIDQNAQLSGQLTLWNQQGSHVLRGNLLVIPTGHALLYAEPIYLQAQQSPMPELRLVVLALQDRLAYGPTFEAALGSLFNGQESSLTLDQGQQEQQEQPGTAASQELAPGTNAAANPAASPTGTQANPLIGQASKAFADYERLTSAGKLGQAGQRLDDLKQILEKLSAGQK